MKALCEEGVSIHRESSDFPQSTPCLHISGLPSVAASGEKVSGVRHTRTSPSGVSPRVEVVRKFGEPGFESVVRSKPSGIQHRNILVYFEDRLLLLALVCWL